ncbi:MAG: GspH/FimT family pseudopilin [Cocleimonas sp.]|nr:GspH/FimT family pseudopilin [Cocleimonas sp.]
MKNKHHHGFTLIEAMVTIAVAGILLSIAIPSFSKMIERNRISSATNEFMAAMMLTRSEAVTRTIPISICASDTGTSCNGALDNYAKGWVIFSDCNMDGLITATVTNCDFDGNGTNDKDAIIKVNNGAKKLLIIGGNATTKDRFTYRVSGRPSTLGASFSIGADSSNLKKKLTVALTGRVKLCTIGESGCP